MTGRTARLWQVLVTGNTHNFTMPLPRTKGKRVAIDRVQNGINCGVERGPGGPPGAGIHPVPSVPANAYGCKAACAAARRAIGTR